MKKFFVGLARILTIATFFMPLVVVPNSFVFPFIVPKIVIFRTLILLLVAVYVLLLFLNKQEFRPKASYLHWVVLFSAVVLFISTFTGVDFHNSFWDTHERMLGTFTMIHYFLYYLVLSSVFKEKEEWRKLLWWFLSAGSMVMGIGMLQRVYPDLLLNGQSWRVVSTLGNAIYVGGYGLFLSYLGYYLGIKETTKWKKYTAFLLGFVGVIGIFLSGTRGTMLGLFGSVGLMLLIYIFCLKEYKKMRLGVSAVMIAGIVLLGILYINRSSSFVENNLPSLGRLLNTTISGDTGGTRIMAWKIAAESFTDHPFFGWGQNNFYYAFNTYYKPAFLFYGVGETWFDNAHNVIMNTLSTGGIFGLIGYLGLFGVSVYILAVAYKKKNIDVHLLAVGVASLVGHFIHNIFVFEDPTSLLYFYFFLAFIEVSVRGPREKNVPDKGLSTGLIITVSIVTLFLISNTNLNVARANNANLEALRFLSGGQAGPAFQMYERAKSFSSPHIYDIRNDFVRMGAELVQNALTTKTVNKDVRDVFDRLYAEEKINRAERPNDIRIAILQIQMDLLGNYLNPSGGYLADAEAMCQEAMKLSPDRQQLKFLQSSIKIQQGKFEDAIAATQKAVDDYPLAAESWIHLALTYAQINQVDKVPAVIEDALKRGVVFNEVQQATLKRSFGITVP